MSGIYNISCVIIATLLIAIPAMAQNTQITWIGQSGFMIQSEGGPTVIADPPSPTLGYPIPNVEANAVSITHNHGDHNYVAGVKGNFTLVDGRPVTTRTQMTAANMPFVLIPGFHDGQNGAASGPNTIVQWTQSGLRFAHFGDMGQDSLTEAQLADLQNLDVAFIPAGGYFTVDADQEAALVNQIGARITILMHYRTALGGPAQAASLPAVATPFANVVYKPSSVTISKAALPRTREVWVMEPLSSAEVVNAASFTPGAPVAPASLATVLGNFAGASTQGATQIPLPATLGQTQVQINGAAVPLAYVSTNQINLQIPGALAPGQYLVDVRVAGQTAARSTVTVVTRAPGVFTIVNADGSLNSSSTPARSGDTIQIYGTGQGPSSGTSGVADGAAAPNTPALTRGLPTITVGGVKATVQRSALAPGQVGVWQITVTVPSGTAKGAVPLTMSTGGQTTVTTLAIQ